MRDGASKSWDTERMKNKGGYEESKMSENEGRKHSKKMERKWMKIERKEIEEKKKEKNESQYWCYFISGVYVTICWWGGCKFTTIN